MNATTNISKCPHPLDDPAAKIGVVLFFCLISILSAFGNCCIGLIVYRIKSMRKPINFLVVNMAMSDLLLLITAVLELLHALQFRIFERSTGRILCVLKHFLPGTSVIVSIQTVVLIAFERFEAVVFPLRSPIIGGKLCRFFVLGTWIVAIAVILPPSVTFQVDSEQMMCEIRRWKEMFGESSFHRNYLLAKVVVFFYLPLLIITVLYSVIFWKLKFQTKPGEQSSQSEDQRKKRNKKVLNLSIAIVIGFTLCWIPYGIGAVFKFVVTLPCNFRPFWAFALVMVASNSAVNPCICFIFSSNFRRGLKRILKSCLRI